MLERGVTHKKKLEFKAKKNAIDGKFNWSMKYIGKWFLTMKLRSKDIFKINFFPFVKEFKIVSNVIYVVQKYIYKYMHEIFITFPNVIHRYVSIRVARQNYINYT